LRYSKAYRWSRMDIMHRRMACDTLRATADNRPKSCDRRISVEPETLLVNSERASHIIGRQSRMQRPYQRPTAMSGSAAFGYIVNDALVKVGLDPSVIPIPTPWRDALKLEPEQPYLLNCFQSMVKLQGGLYIRLDIFTCLMYYILNCERGGVGLGYGLHLTWSRRQSCHTGIRCRTQVRSAYLASS
jgi:hypothetical protein